MSGTAQYLYLEKLRYLLQHQERTPTRYRSSRTDYPTIVPSLMKIRHRIQAVRVLKRLRISRCLRQFQILRIGCLPILQFRYIIYLARPRNRIAPQVNRSPNSVFAFDEYLIFLPHT
jgi:hypothetical protein